MVDVCASLQGILETSIYPSAAIASLATAALIGVTYMVSQMIQNPRLSTWAKTEAPQLITSTVFAFLVVFLIQTTCVMKVDSVSSIVDLAQVQGVDLTLPLLDGSAAYVKNVASFAHNATVNTRYYLGTINLLESQSIWKCPLWCFFSQGGTGTSYMPGSGASYMTAGFMVAFNVALMGYMNALMHLYFLGYIQSGFFLFLLPLGIMLRALPYMRQVGSLLLAVVFGFFVVYPLILASFYVGVEPPVLEAKDENALADTGGVGGWLSGSVGLPSVGSNEMMDTLGNASSAFLYSVFVLTLAILATAAAIAYFARLMGEEVDLSRIIQMV